MNRCVSSLIALVLLAACTPPSQEARARQEAEGSGRKPANALTCFPDEGPVAFEVDGVPVPVAAVERLVSFARRSQPEAAEDEVTRAVIEQRILPLAASFAHYEEKRGAMLAWARSVRERATDTAAVRRLAREENDFEWRRQQDRAPIISRFGPPRQQRPPLPLPVRLAAWDTPIGRMSDPVVTAEGVWLVRPESEGRGASEATDYRHCEVILKAWEPAARRDLVVVQVPMGQGRVASQRVPRLVQIQRELREDARVVIRQDRYKEVIPSRYWHR